MTSPHRHFAQRLVRSGLRASLLVALLGTTACKTLTAFVVAEAAEAITGQEVDMRDLGDGEGYDLLVNGEGSEPPGGAATSVYVYGPVRGWERGLRATASAPGSPYFLTRLSSDGCPTFDLGEGHALFGGGDPADPFGPLVRPAGRVVLHGNTLDIDDDYVRFGRVPVGGTASEARLWSRLRMFGMVGGPCAFLGLPLISFGPRTDDPVISR